MKVEKNEAVRAAIEFALIQADHDAVANMKKLLAHPEMENLGLYSTKFCLILSISNPRVFEVQKQYYESGHWDGGDAEVSDALWEIRLLQLKNAPSR